MTLINEGQWKQIIKNKDAVKILFWGNWWSLFRKKILEITTSVQLKRPEKEQSRLYEIRRNPSKRKSVRQKNLDLINVRTHWKVGKLAPLANLDEVKGRTMFYKQEGKMDRITGRETFKEENVFTNTLTNMVK